MKRISCMIIICVACFQMSYSQTINLFGKVQSISDVENIHVINKTAQKFTVTNASGEFRVSVSLNDTLVFSSIQYKLLTVLVDEQIMLDKTLVVSLEIQVNELDQVVIGKVLSGDMLLDVSNVEGEPMTSKKAGIPSYQGKLKTQSERRLQEASDLNPTLGGSLGGVGGSVGLIPIINAISGRTKMLKTHVKLEEKETLMFNIKVRLSKGLFSMVHLEDDRIMEYFYFVSEADDFLKRCKKKRDVEILEYLKEKLIAFKLIISTKTNIKPF